MKRNIFAFVIATAVLSGVQVAYIRVTQLRGGVANRIVTDNGTTAQWATMSGDATMLYGGAITVAKANGNAFPVATVAGGEFWYGTGAGTLGVLAANTTGTKKFLSMTSSVPSWGALSAGDLPALAGDVTGTISANTVGKVQNVAVKAAMPNGNDVLTYVAANSRWEPLPWSTGLPAASTAGRMVYDNGSGWSASAAGTTGQTLRMNGTVPTFNSVLTNDGTTVTVNGGASSALALSVNGATSNSVVPFEVTSPSSTAVARFTATTQPAFVNFRTGVTPGAGSTVASYSFTGTTLGSTFVQGASVSGIANESWDATHAGTDLVFQVVAPSSTSLTTRVRLYADGDVSLYGSGAEAPTSASSGFVFIPTTNGIPTAGSGRSITGAAGLKLNRATNVLYSSISGATPTPITVPGQTVLSTSVLASTGSATASTIASTTDVVFVDTSAGGTYTPTLPAASARIGRPITIRRMNGGIANVIITRAGSDTVEGSTTMTLTSTSSVTLIPNGADWVTLSRSAA